MKLGASSFIFTVPMTPLQKRLDKTHPDCTLLDWWIV